LPLPNKSSNKRKRLANLRCLLDILREMTATTAATTTTTSTTTATLPQHETLNETHLQSPHPHTITTPLVRALFWSAAVSQSRSLEGRQHFFSHSFMLFTTTKAKQDIFYRNDKT